MTQIIGSHPEGPKKLITGLLGPTFSIFRENSWDRQKKVGPTWSRLKKIDKNRVQVACFYLFFSTNFEKFSDQRKMI